MKSALLSQNCDTIAAKRRHSVDVQRGKLTGILADICAKDLDLNFIKIHLLSHFGDHIRCVLNIHLYSTKAGETNDKTRMKEGYQDSNKTTRVIKYYKHMFNVTASILMK